LKVSNHSGLLRPSGNEGVKITSSGGVVTIEDGGVGMTREELEVNLGTIARSGSREFVSEGKDADGDIIGKFGVGFYSAFMVGERVEVHSKSAKEEGGGFTWKSDGGGEFEIVEGADEDFERGCRIKIFLKEGEKEEWGKERLKEVIKKYSNFVNFPITLNDEEVNTVEAVWSKMPSEVSDDTHKEFYRFVSGAFDEPMYKLHYRADAPLDIKALLYIPKFHTEKYGMGRMEKGVSLYSRKVLIESKSDVMPEWLRFVKGVVDCEDLPLSISREKAQDSRLVAKLRQATTRRLVSELEKFKRKEGEKFRTEFWPEFGHFIKEGVCQDYQFQSQLSKLLHFESSKSPAGELTTLEEVRWGGFMRSYGLGY
jgi:HSP90 family molecular chaperone